MKLPTTKIFLNIQGRHRGAGQRRIRLSILDFN